MPSISMILNLENKVCDELQIGMPLFEEELF